MTEFLAGAPLSRSRCVPGFVSPGTHLLKCESPSCKEMNTLTPDTFRKKLLKIEKVESFWESF